MDFKSFIEYNQDTYSHIIFEIINDKINLISDIEHQESRNVLLNNFYSTLEKIDLTKLDKNGMNLILDIKKRLDDEILWEELIKNPNHLFFIDLSACFRHGFNIAI